MPVVVTDPLAYNKAVVLWDTAFQDAALQGTADGTQAPALNAITDSTYDYWSAASGVTTRLTKTGSSFNISADAFGFSGHNLATTAAQIWVQWSNDAVTWVDAFDRYSPLTNDPVLFIFPLQNRLYWRVSFLGTSQSYVSNIKLGKRLDFPCTPVVGYTPVHHAMRYEKLFNNSIEGHLLGNRVIAKGGTTDVTFPEIRRSFVDSELPGFEDHYNRGRTFFYAGWPQGKPKDMGYCWANSQDATVAVTYTGGNKLATVNFGINIHATT